MTRQRRTPNPENRSFPRWLILAGLSVACLNGCQHAAYRPPSAALGTAKEDAPKALTPSQLADVKVAFGRTLEKQGQTPQAMAAYQEALKNDPKRADAYLRLAVLDDQQGKFPAAADSYKKALALQPGNADIYCNMGYSLYLQQRFQEAEMNLRQAVALEPGHRRAHNNLALVLAQFGRRDEALAEFHKGGCKDAEAHANLGFILALQRELPDASMEYEQALAADPSLPVARKGLQEVKILQARFNSPEKEKSAK